MTSEWRVLPLGEACSKITDGAHNSPKSVDSGKPMASVKDLTRFGVDLSQARHIAPEDFAALIRQGCRPEVGDVLIAKDGNSALDTVCMVKEPLDAVLLSSVAILRPNPKLVASAYLKHYLSSPDVIEYLKSNFISGAAIPRVVLKDFKKALIRIPPIDVQLRIASILDTFDDHIALLRETNATLEAIAQALFKSWFVNFDPVRAKAEGREPDGLDADTAALFPDRFVESELGPVPWGWQVGTLEDLLVLQRGFDLPAADRVPGAYPIIAASGPAGSHVKAMVNGPGVITGRSGVLGRVYLELDNFWPLNTTLWIKDFRGATPCYAYELLKTIDLHSFNAGSAVPTLNRNHVHGLKQLVPSRSCVMKYEAIAMSLHERMRVNAAHSDALGEIRDALLPRLISGHIDLSKLSRMSEEYPQ